MNSSNGQTLEEDLKNLLQLLPFPIILYDRVMDKVIYANGAFEKLTDKDNSQVIGISLSQLFPEDIDTNPNIDLWHPVSFFSRKGDPIKQYLKVHPFSSTNQKVVLSFEEFAQNGLRDDLINQERSFAFVNGIVPMINPMDEVQLFKGASTLIEDLTGSRNIAIYQAVNGSSYLERKSYDFISPPPFLPVKLPFDEVKKLGQPVFWKNNRKTISSLHVLADLAGYGWLITIPVRKSDTWMGLLVVCGIDNPPEDVNLQYLSLIGSVVVESLNLLHEKSIQKTSLQRLKQVIQIEHSIIDNVEEGIIVLTPDLKIAEMNPAAEIILGYTNKEVFKLPIEEILIGSDSLKSAFNSSKQGITTLVSNDLRLHNRNGKSFPAQVISIPVLTDKSVIGIIILLKDTSQSEIVRVKTQQLEQRAFLGEVSAVFAHEVKNPINSIMTGLQFLGMSQDPNSPHIDLINRLQNDCVRLTHLMDSVLSFSKPVEFHMAAVDLGQVLPNLLDRWEPRMRRVSISSSYYSSLEESLVLGDIRALEQVFVNLVNNAVQAMEKTGGSLSIKVHNPSDPDVSDMIEITVSDSGPGIPDDIRDHIFEPFMTTNQNGTGLGLAISKRIITAHRGNIFVESFAGGTIFHVLIPRYNGEPK